MEDIIKEIKTDCRLAMNGVLSTSMRERGIVYKLNFGVEYPRIKQISQKKMDSMNLTWNCQDIRKKM